MVKSRTIAAACAIALFGVTGAVSAHEDSHRIVLNGRINTADFDGGVGDRFGDGGYAGSYGYAISYGGAFASTHAAVSAHAFARASAFARSSFRGSGVHGGHR